MWAGPDLEMTNFYDEGGLMQSMPHYFGDFHKRREQDAGDVSATVRRVSSSHLNY